MQTLEKNIISEICETYNISKETLNKLTEMTNIGGCMFVNVKKYISDVSNDTEMADQLINVGASYDNMLKKDSVILSEISLENIDLSKFNYSSIETKQKTIEEFKIDVKMALPLALEELKAPKKEVANNNIYVNNVLIYNTNTKNLLLRGTSVNKVVKVQGEFKKVASAPKTVAKELIKNQFLKSSKLRTFKISKIESINLKGNTLEIK